MLGILFNYLHSLCLLFAKFCWSRYNFTEKAKKFQRNVNYLDQGYTTSKQTGTRLQLRLAYLFVYINILYNI